VSLANHPVAEAAGDLGAGEVRLVVMDLDPVDFRHREGGAGISP
jgi:hypothetical protein